MSDTAIKKKKKECKKTLRPKYIRKSEMYCTYCDELLWEMETTDGGSMLECKHCSKLDGTKMGN